jgi:hypothetical protein
MAEAQDELVIDESNFDQYFFDLRRHTPKKGQIIACYTTMAELIEGDEKGHLIDLLFKKDKALPATQVMRKLFCADEKDSLRVLWRSAKT